MKHRRAVLILPLLALTFGLLIWPTVVLALRSFQSTGDILQASSAAGFSFRNYASIVVDPYYRGALLHSILLSLFVACGSILLCLCPAWLFVRKEFPSKRFLRALFTLPMSFSGIIVGFIVVIMLGRIGFVPLVLERMTGRPWLSGLAYRFCGLVVAYIYFEIPRATLTLESSLRKFNFQLEAAARSLGANRWQRLMYVVLPLILPALLSAFAVTFSVSLGSFGVALIVSKRFSILPVELYDQLIGFLNTGLAAAMGVVLMLIAFVVNYSMRNLGRSEEERLG